MGVVHVSKTSGHPGGKIAPRRAEHDHPASGHVLATVVAHALDDGQGARISYAKAFSDDPSYENLAAGSAVTDDVAGDYVGFGDEAGGYVEGRPHDNAPPGETLAEVIVGVAVKAQRDPGRHEGAETLARPNRSVRGRWCPAGARRRHNVWSPPTRAWCPRPGWNWPPATSRAPRCPPRARGGRPRSDWHPACARAGGLAGESHATATPSGGGTSRSDRSRVAAFWWPAGASADSTSVWPMASSSVLNPSSASHSLTSSATYSKKLTTRSGVPAKALS